MERKERLDFEVHEPYLIKKITYRESFVYALVRKSDGKYLLQSKDRKELTSHIKSLQKHARKELERYIFWRKTIVNLRKIPYFYWSALS